MICRICSNLDNNKSLRIREMMFGLRDEFSYFECSRCGCLQIAETEIDIERYYPSNYYSFQQRSSSGFIARLINGRRNRYVLFRTGLLGRLFYNFPTVTRMLQFGSSNKITPGEFDAILTAMSRINLNQDLCILDVGCGSGGLLLSLREVGFRKLIGVDPYINHEVIEPDLRILRCNIHDLPDEQKFDLIIFNHSFEHIPDQLETLLKTSSLLNEKGTCLIRMPLKTEYIWNLYSVNWIQIDAPRHFLIHTMNSFDYSARRAGLKIKDVVFDSTELQFWGSAQYQRDIPLEAVNSYKSNPSRGIFTPKQIEEFAEKTRELNRTSQGDQAAFYLMKNLL